MADYILSKTGAAVDSALAHAEKAVRFDSQSLSASEKAQAQSNMGVPSVAALSAVSSSLASEVTARTAAVSAVNSALNSAVASVNANIGSLSNLDTTTKSNVVSAINETVEVIDTKADKDGYYDELSVGAADNLISENKYDDQVPYILRKAGGRLEVGNQLEEEALVGFQGIWVSYPPTATSSWSVWSSTTCEVTYTASTYTTKLRSKTAGSGKRNIRLNRAFRSGHIYYVAADIYSPTVKASLAYGTGYGPITGGSYGIGSTFLSHSADSSGFKHYEVILRIPHGTYTGAQTSHYGEPIKDREFYFCISDASAADTYAEIKNLTILDLDLIFGTEAAQYLLDSGTNGAEIIKSLFPNQNYGRENAVRHVTIISKKISTGFNLYDYDNNKAKVVGGYRYQIEGSYTSYTYTPYGGKAVTVLSTDDGASTPLFNYNGEVIFAGADTDLCLHFKKEGQRDGEKEEYIEHEYEFDSSISLRGFLKFDANGSPYIYGDTYTSNGVITRKLASVMASDLEWSYDSESGLFYTSIDNLKLGGYISIAGFYRQYHGTLSEVPSTFKWYTWDDENLYSSTNLVIKNPEYTTLSDFEESISSYAIIYELATFTTESADSYTKIQIVDNWGTEEFVDTSTSHAFPWPCGHISKYTMDLKGKLESSPNSPSEDGTYLMQRINGVNSYTPYIPVSTDSFLITVTQDGYDFISDKDYSEILNAYQAGRRLILKADNFTSDGENFVTGYAELSGYIESITGSAPSFKFVVYFDEYYMAYICSVKEEDEETVVNVYGFGI